MDEQRDFAESVPSSKRRRTDRLAYDYRSFISMPTAVSSAAWT
jgi:hypothetical protein